MLTNFLNKQPDISCESEIFHHLNIVFPPLDTFTSWAKDWVNVCGSLEDAVVQKFINPDNFLNFLKNKTTKKTAGYKLLLPQLHFFKREFKFLEAPRYNKTANYEYRNKNFDVFEHLKNKNGKVIFLKRRNEFLRSLSALKSWRTNDPIIGKNNNKIFYEDGKKDIIFNVRYYLNGLRDLNDTDAELEAFLKKENIPYITTYYEDLIGPNSDTHYRKITAFLGQPKESFTSIRNEELDIIKLNTFTLKSQIKNFKYVADVLKNDKGFQDALKEEKQNIVKQRKISATESPSTKNIKKAKTKR
jgi:hypothetical protein